MILFDANILIHAHAAESPFHHAAHHLRDQAAEGHLEACLSPQVLCEFFAVVTDKRMVKPALTPAQAKKDVQTYWRASQFRKILPREETMTRLMHLLDQHPLKRADIFDAFLAATMLDNNVRTIYTQNTKDFEKYRELRVINPFMAMTPHAS